MAQWVPALKQFFGIKPTPKPRGPVGGGRPIPAAPTRHAQQPPELTAASSHDEILAEMHKDQNPHIQNSRTEQSLYAQSFTHIENTEKQLDEVEAVMLRLTSEKKELLRPWRKKMDAMPPAVKRKWARIRGQVSNCEARCSKLHNRLFLLEQARTTTEETEGDKEVFEYLKRVTAHNKQKQSALRDQDISQLSEEMRENIKRAQEFELAVEAMGEGISAAARGFHSTEAAKFDLEDELMADFEGLTDDEEEQQEAAPETPQVTATSTTTKPKEPDVSEAAPKPQRETEKKPEPRVPAAAV